MVSIIPQTFWQFSFAVVPGQVLISSLLKNSFGPSFRCALRHGISLFVGFWRGGILYSVRDGVFRSLFQQPANRALTAHGGITRCQSAPLGCGRTTSNA